MKVLFRYQEVSDIVENGSVAKLGTTHAQKATTKKKDNKALFLLHQCVNDVHFEKIQHAKTTKEAWGMLIQCHAGGEKIKKVRLQTLRK